MRRPLANRNVSERYFFNVFQLRTIIYISAKLTNKYVVSILKMSTEKFLENVIALIQDR